MYLIQSFGDFVHIFAYIFLLVRIWLLRSCTGISAKSQVLLALVSTARYLDLTYSAVLSYFWSMKVTFLFLSYAILISIFWIFRKSHEKQNDTFRFEILICISIILSFFLSYDLSVLEIFWAFSLYLEAVAMWPQFYMAYHTKTIRKDIFAYVTMVGIYRFLYVVHWIYRYYTQNHKDWISWGAGTFQVVSFWVFWSLCITKIIIITNETNSHYSQNLTQENQIFTITISDKAGLKGVDQEHSDTKQLIEE